jgi:serine/threonine protein kinase
MAVAIKSIKKEKMSENQMSYHRREIDTLKMCQHPNIIKLLDIYETFDHFFIVLELMEGGDLYRYLERRNGLVPE